MAFEDEVLFVYQEISASGGAPRVLNWAVFPD
jgi:hypothetical protein